MIRVQSGIRFSPLKVKYFLLTFIFCCTKRQKMRSVHLKTSHEFNVVPFYNFCYDKLCFSPFNLHSNFTLAPQLVIVTVKFSDLNSWTKSAHVVATWARFRGKKITPFIFQLSLKFRFGPLCFNFYSNFKWWSNGRTILKLKLKFKVFVEIKRWGSKMKFRWMLKDQKCNLTLLLILDKNWWWRNYSGFIFGIWQTLRIIYPISCLKWIMQHVKCTLFMK